LTSRLLAALLVVALLALAAPGMALGARDGGAAEPAAGPTWDTPEPTPRETEGPQRTPRPPDQTSPPEPTPDPTDPTVSGPQPIAPVAARTSLRIAFREPGAGGQAPLLLAREAGYLADAGITDVTIVQIADAIDLLVAGELDLAVVDARRAWEAWQAEPRLQALAGFRNYAGPDGTYGGDLILAAPGLADAEPGTLIAFLVAYIRALQDLGDPDSLAAAAATLDALDPPLDAGAPEWTADVDAFAPFDGGFGSVEDEGALGELAEWLADAGEASPVPDPDPLLAEHLLTIAQAVLGLPANSASDLVGPPGRPDIRVGLPGGDRASPVLVALEAGYLEDAGFTSVEVMDVEQPILGVLNGQLEFSVMDTAQAADGVAQGLPLRALAGHELRDGATGEFGGDVLVAASDLLADDGSTATAFLIAYLRALQDLREDPDGAAFAPHDGGFGSPEQEGGLGELRAFLAGSLDPAPDVEVLIARAPLAFAQAWWGLPANPSGPPVSEAPPVEDAE
jgi:ABC-type nitrate/sulfonate/bicarbonate transport system substrate-binding protein